MRPTPVIDAAHGARITSLRFGFGELLWSRASAYRNTASFGDVFVDVGGIEECFPTVAGNPDHGCVWTRPWQEVSPWRHSCQYGSCRLERAIEVSEETVDFNYLLEAPPGDSFVWAMHALIDPAVDLRLDIPAGAVIQTWPFGYRHPPNTATWPIAIEGRAYDDMSVDDGTATFAFLPLTTSLGVRYRRTHVRFDLAAPGQPAGIGLWRNLGGYGWDNTSAYRSLGVEPMLGTTPDANAPYGEAAHVPDGGIQEWTVRITAEQADTDNTLSRAARR